MPETHVSWFSGEQFLPHGHCYMWTPGILWMHVIADILIAMAYFAIPFVLIYVARRRRDLPFGGLLLCGGVFIVCCGLTHLLDVWNVWHTDYWLEGMLKVATAVASVPTAILLWRSLPFIMTVPSQRQLRDANESLARANHELEAFTASVSHDLRSPLTTIAGQAGLLELSMPHGSEEQRRRLTRIQNSVKQMSELIDALLALSRISRHTLHREIIDVSALAESIIQDLRLRDPYRQVTVNIQPGMSVHGDRSLINDLFVNVLSNAWKFTSRTEAARIEVGQSQHGSMATLFVRDAEIRAGSAPLHAVWRDAAAPGSALREEMCEFMQECALGLRGAVTSLLAGHGQAHFGVNWRVGVFHLLVRLNRHFPLVPRLPGRRQASPAA